MGLVAPGVDGIVQSASMGPWPNTQGLSKMSERHVKLSKCMDSYHGNHHGVMKQ